MANLIDKCGNTKHYPLEMYQNGISKDTISSVTGKMEDGITLSSSDSATASKRKKNRLETFKYQMKEHCLSIKAQYDELLKNG